MQNDYISGYAFHLVCRIGTEAQIPALVMGELGFDTDTKTLRVGNDTAVPEKIMTTKSTGDFVYSNVGYVEFPEIRLPAGGKVDGIDISTLAGNSAGFLVNDGTGVFSNVILNSGDGSITITTPSGVGGNPDLRVSPALLSSFLTLVTTDTSLTGLGTATVPLSVAAASTSQKGAVVLASNAEALAGTDAYKAITPAALRFALNSPTTPILPAASTSMPGTTVYATAAEVIAGVLDNKSISPQALHGAIPAILPYANQTTTGIARLANGAESLAATDWTIAITPGGVAYYVSNYVAAHASQLPANSPGVLRNNGTGYWWDNSSLLPGNAAGYLHNDGWGNLSWQTPASGGGGSSSAPTTYGIGSYVIGAPGNYGVGDTLAGATYNGGPGVSALWYWASGGSILIHVSGGTWRFQGMLPNIGQVPLTSDYGLWVRIA